MPTKPDAKVVDFDAKRKKKTPTVRATLTAFGKNWKLMRPNQMVASLLVDAEGDINPAQVTNYLLAHVVPEQRDEFMVAATQDETLDIEALMDLMGMMTEAVYDGVPSAPS